MPERSSHVGCGGVPRRPSPDGHPTLICVTDGSATPSTAGGSASPSATTSPPCVTAAMDKALQLCVVAMAGTDGALVLLCISDALTGTPHMKATSVSCNSSNITCSLGSNLYHDLNFVFFVESVIFW
jgi:hypothetical protein